MMSTIYQNNVPYWNDYNKASGCNQNQNQNQNQIEMYYY